MLPSLHPAKRPRIAGDSPEAETATAREIVSKSRTEMARLKARIQDLEKIILDNERRIFSINRLPPEILLTIFQYSSPPFTEPCPCYVERQGPLLVSQVCRRWRNVALSSQSLWSFPTIYAENNQIPSQMNRHLARAGTADLHPALYASEKNVKSFAKLLAPLAATSDRWVSALIAFDWVYFEDEIGAVHDHVGRLEELQIEGFWGGDDEEDHPFAEEGKLTAFSIAPRLRKLRVKGVCEPTVSLGLPWHQLTDYRGLGTAYDHIEVLKCCQNLVRLHLMFSEPASIVDDAPVLVELPHLTDLHLGESALLRVMSLPKLHTLAVQRIPEGTEAVDALLPLLELIQREPPPNLSSLSLVGSTLVTPTLISILELLPVLDTLRLPLRRCNTTALNEIFTRLTVKPLHPECHCQCLSHNLQTLELDGRSATFDQANLVEMVRSRSAPEQMMNCGCMPIRRLGLRTGKIRPIQPSIAEELGTLAVDSKFSLNIRTSFIVDSDGAADTARYWAT
ncbi:F-box domain-containing protein [Favolaschia claudopus]|uniref:F-box domain-containing protein n=1 Tax=Favolaschia claudopus TaxID=2862362 RepID=A0AAW0DM14_9AGAR